MLKKQIYKITITNWDKYNKNLKPGHKKILISVGFLSDAKIRSLTPTGKLLFLSCLLLAGESTQSQFEVNHESLSFHSGVKSGSIQSQLDRLQSFQLLTWEKIEVLNNRIEKKRKEKNINIDQNRNFDRFSFDEIYKKYPRKVGKTKGFTICKNQIKTKEDFEKLNQAVDRYVANCQENKKPAEYIMHFSTFMGSWRDWIESDTGTSLDFSENDSFALLEKELREKNEL